MDKFGLINKFTVAEGKRDTLVDILVGAAQSMEELDDCEIYLVNASTEEPDAVYIYEVWKDEDAHKASLSLESTQTLIQRAKPIIKGVDRVCTLEPKGGKSVPITS